MRRRSLLSLGALVALAGCAGDDALSDVTENGDDDDDDDQPDDTDDTDDGTEPVSDAVDRSAIFDQTAEALANEPFEFEYTLAELDENEAVAFGQSLQMRGDPDTQEIVGNLAAAEGPVDGPEERATINGGLYVTENGLTEWELGENSNNQITDQSLTYNGQIEELTGTLEAMYGEAEMFEFGEPTDENGIISVPVTGVDDEENGQEMTVHEGSLEHHEDDTLAGFYIEIESSSGHLILSVDSAFDDIDDVTEPSWMDEEIRAEFEALEALQQEINTLEQALGPGHDQELASLQDEREHRLNEYDDITAHLDDLQDELAQIEASLAEIEEDLNETDLALHETEQALEEAETQEEHEEYLMQLDELAMEYDQLQEQQHMLQHERDAFEDEIEAIEQQREGLASHIDDLDDQIDDLEEELEEMPDPEEAEAELDELTAEFEAKRDALHEQLLNA